MPRANPGRCVLDLPDEILLRALNPRRNDKESCHDYWSRLAKTAALCVRFANLLRPTLYNIVYIELGYDTKLINDLVRHYIRHLHGCAPALVNTSILEFERIIEWASEDNNIYQVITPDQIARATSYTPRCKDLKLLFLEIIDPNFECISGRRHLYTLPPPFNEPQELSDLWSDDSLSVVSYMSEGEELNKAILKADRDAIDEEIDSKPLPTEAPSIQTLMIMESYNTTPNAISAILALLPNLSKLRLEDIYWRPNELPAIEPTCKHLRHLICLDVARDDCDVPNEELDRCNPPFPILTRDGVTANLEYLHIGFENPERTNSNDIRGWRRIPLERFLYLKELLISFQITHGMGAGQTQFLFESIAILLQRAPPSLDLLTIALQPEAIEDEYCFFHIKTRYWNMITNAAPTTLKTIIVSFLVDSTIPLRNSAHYRDVHNAFERNPHTTVKVTYTHRRKWQELMDPQYHASP